MAHSFQQIPPQTTRKSFKLFRVVWGGICWKERAKPWHIPSNRYPPKQHGSYGDLPTPAPESPCCNKGTILVDKDGDESTDPNVMRWLFNGNGCDAVEGDLGDEFKAIRGHLVKGNYAKSIPQPQFFKSPTSAMSYCKMADDCEVGPTSSPELRKDGGRLRGRTDERLLQDGGRLRGRTDEQS